MLSGDFFYITNLQQENGEINALLRVNSTHKIFDGHFPGQPVVPGVCMIQMVKEILESALDRPTRLLRAGDIKFLAVINPGEMRTIRVEIKYSPGEEGTIKVAALLVDDTITYFKMNGVFVFEEKQ